MLNKNIINTSQCFPFWSFETSHISKYDSFFFRGFPQTPLLSNMSVHHHLFVRLRSQRTGPNKICSVQEMETKGRRRREEEGDGGTFCERGDFRHINEFI